MNLQTIVQQVFGYSEIETLYSKGIEYKNHGEDYTRAISLEVKALKNKGKIVYTNENVMSSLI